MIPYVTLPLKGRGYDSYSLGKLAAMRLQGEGK